MSNEFNRTLTEVNEILNLSDEDIIKTIPYAFRKMIVQNMDKTHDFKIDTTKTLEKQNISDKTKDFIALMYRNYIADEVEKDFIVQKENELMQYRKMGRKQ